MRKLSLFIFSVALVLSLCACGAEKTGLSPDETQCMPVPAASAESTGTDSGSAAVPAAGPEPIEYGEPEISQWAELNAAEPNYQIMVPVKNVSDNYLTLMGATYTLTDKSGNEIAVLRSADCSPAFLAPGQEGVIYQTAVNKNGTDYLNPDYTLTFEAEFEPMPENDIVPLEVSNLQFYKNLGSIEIVGDLTNDTIHELSFPYISFLFYDENGNILCGAFCMGGVSDRSADDFGILHAYTTCPFTGYRYWLPGDYPLEKATMKAYGYGILFH